jgi:hypothetical protein
MRDTPIGDEDCLGRTSWWLAHLLLVIPHFLRCVGDGCGHDGMVVEAEVEAWCLPEQPGLFQQLWVFITPLLLGCFATVNNYVSCMRTGGLHLHKRYAYRNTGLSPNLARP